MNITLDFIGVGAPRAATTWLHTCLHEHPDIYVPQQKELNYFSTHTLFTTTNHMLGTRWYQEQFTGSKNYRICGEISPSYFADPKTAERIAKTFPKAKVLINLRNPIDALYSSYRLGSCFYNLGKTFEDFLAEKPEFKGHFIYAKQVQQYLRYFDQDQIHYTFFHNILSNPERVLHDLYQFLDVPYHSPQCLNTAINNCNGCKSTALRSALESTKRNLDRFPAVEYCYKRIGIDRIGKRLAQLNAQKTKTLPPMHPETRQLLLEYYKRHNEELSDLLAIDLSHWNSPTANAHDKHGTF